MANPSSGTFTLTEGLVAPLLSVSMGVDAQSSPLVDHRPMAALIIARLNTTTTFAVVPVGTAAITRLAMLALPLGLMVASDTGTEAATPPMVTLVRLKAVPPLA